MAAQDARLRAVRILMGVAALGASVAAVGAIESVADAGAASGAAIAVVSDGVLTAILLVAYVLGAGWRSQ
jgi:hypothetical protein